MDADTIIRGWQARLIAMADWPAYVFRNTEADLIDRHYQHVTQFAGYSEADIAAVETSLGVQFPSVFRAYLRLMARSPGGLFRGSDLAGIGEFPQFRQSALDLLAETDPTLSLPPQAVVFMSHQGYTFIYLECAGGFDSAPMQWLEGKPSPKRVADGFAQMVDV